ncbi:hemolysin family protein [Planococcus sp. CP5-4]|nr:hemolysin family protein [Planococcus sp. CP5-4_YE]MBV0910057.1 hemolysin family protein [Planococcus sp. CP5-4_UN]MBW6064591.1 hemolysin family protein [Planococcus sp. CP5-4]
MHLLVGIALISTIFHFQEVQTLCPSLTGPAQRSHLDIPLRIIAIAALIGSAAFFSACEYAIVNIRSSRLDESIANNQKQAHAAVKIAGQADTYLFACQVGIALSVLGLGWVGHALVQETVHFIAGNLGLSASSAGWISFLMAFLAVALLLVIFGELFPKTFAIRNPEQVILLLAKPLTFSYALMFPFIFLFSAIARLISALFGIQKLSRSEMGHTEEELKLLLSESLKSGEINVSEFDYVNRIFEFDERIAKEIMVPRMEMSTIAHDISLREVFTLEGIEQFTRYPITDGSKDHVLGVVNMKHLLSAYVKNPDTGNLPVSAFIQPVIQVIETIPVNELLLKIQRERIHMAILRDEYGGTSGLVTIEDILEEIVGDIQDEFDVDEAPDVQKLGEDHYIFNAKLLLDTVNAILGINIDEEDIDTIGGWFMDMHFDAIEGQKIIEQGYEFRIQEVDGHHILYLEVQKAPAEDLPV